MFIGIHMLTGAAIGAVVPNPVVASSLAVTSHYTIDHLPHWHYLPRYQSKFEDLWKIGIEPLISFPLFFALAWVFKWDSRILIPALAATLPDVIEGLQFILKSKALDWHSRLHTFGHWQVRLLPSLPIFFTLMALTSFIIYSAY